MTGETAQAPAALPRVGLMVGTLEAGGAEQSVLQMLRHWPAAARPTLIAGRLSGPLLDSLPDATVSYQLSAHWPAPQAVIPAIWKLRRAVRREEIDVLIVNSTGMRFVTLAAKAARLIDAKVVLFERNTPSRQRMFRRKRLQLLANVSMRLLRSGVDRHVAVSEGVARDTEAVFGLPPGSVEVIPSGIDFDQILALSETAPSDSWSAAAAALPRPLLLSVGRLERAKDHETLLRAFAQLDEGSLLLLGEGALRPAIEQLVEELGLTGRVLVPGYSSNPYWYMRQADLFALTSLYEGMPRALLEALACGSRAVSSRCAPGVRGLLDGKPGRATFPVGDAPAAASAFTRALSEGRPQADQALLDDYSISRTVRALVRLAQELRAARPEQFGAGKCPAKGLK